VVVTAPPDKVKAGGGLARYSLACCWRTPAAALSAACESLQERASGRLTGKAEGSMGICTGGPGATEDTPLTDDTPCNIPVRDTIHMSMATYCTDADNDVPQ
jgi:hypothetical protein